MSAWINFKELRERLSFEQVLGYYRVEIKRKGNHQHMGYCPLPNHKGVRNSPSFSANLQKGIFQCFGCGARGNLLEFAALMEKANLDDGQKLREVAIKLREKFCPESRSTPPKKKAETESKPSESKPKTEPPAIVNEPLDFELKNLNPEHPYLIGRKFSKEIIDHFGLGFCSRGFLKDRVAIPLHDHAGRLIGYAGRVVDDVLIGEENPKYLFPGLRERGEKVFEFRKSLFLYNGFRLKSPVDDLAVVEGFPSVWWLTQLGRENVVSTMGASCSEEQADLIMRMTTLCGRVWIISDGDPAGERHEHEVLIQVARERFTRSIRLETGKQPTDYPKHFYEEKLW